MKNKERARDWSLITYLPEETFLPILENNIQKYAYILHDKDGVTPHWHIVTYTTNPRARNGIKGLFPTEQTTLIERIKVSRKKVFEYLTHKNEKDKHQYTDEEVKTNDIDFWEKEEAESKSTDSLIDDIIAGIPFRELAIRQIDLTTKKTNDIIQTKDQEIYKMVLYVTKQVSKKSGNEYFALVADIGYRKLYLNMQTDILAELCGMSVRELYNLNVDEKISARS